MGMGKNSVLPMSFLQHSGSSSLNPGEAVYLENGMSISHWCRENLGVTNNYHIDVVFFFILANHLIKILSLF